MPPYLHQLRDTNGGKQTRSRSNAEMLSSKSLIILYLLYKRNIDSRRAIAEMETDGDVIAPETEDVGSSIQEQGPPADVDIPATEQ